MLATDAADTADLADPRAAWTQETRVLLRTAGPIVLGQLGAVGMNTMDTIMVGPLGANALAAVGLSSALHMTSIMVCSGVLFGMGPMVSQAFGAGNRARCREVLVQGLWLSLLVSIPVIWLAAEGERLTLALGQPAEVAEIVGRYMGALTWGVLPLLIVFAFRQFLDGMGLTKPTMVITLIGLGVNFLGNRAFIYGVEGWIAPLGAEGSGWATTAVRWCMLLAMLGYVAWHPDLRPFHGARWRPERTLLRRIAGIGVPAGAQVGLEMGLFAFAAVMMGWFGAVQLGTHQVTISIASTTFMVALGTSFAGAIRVGQHVGAGSAEGARRAVVMTYAVSLGFMAICAVLFLAVPEPLLRLYTRDPEMVELGRSLLWMAALFQLFDGAQAAGFCVLRGAADTTVPMLIAALAYWVVGVPAAYLLGFHTALGPAGVWLGLSAGLAAAALLLLVRVRRVIWSPAGIRAVA